MRIQGPQTFCWCILSLLVYIYILYSLLTSVSISFTSWSFVSGGCCFFIYLFLSSPASYFVEVVFVYDEIQVLFFFFFRVKVKNINEYSIFYIYAVCITLKYPFQILDCFIFKVRCFCDVSQNSRFLKKFIFLTYATFIKISIIFHVSINL